MSHSSPADFVTDPGHGGSDSGAINSTTDHREKDIVLDFAKRYNAHFAALTGITPENTRDNDRFVSLSSRATFANVRSAPLLSFHCNAFNTSAHGVEAFTSPGQTSSDPWATALLQAYVAENPNVAKRFDLRDGDPDKEARFAVLTRTNGPAVLIELGFIDSPKDILFLTDPAWRNRTARALALASAKHFKLLLPHLDPNGNRITAPPQLASTEQNNDKDHGIEVAPTPSSPTSPTTPRTQDLKVRLDNIAWQLDAIRKEQGLS